MNVSAVLVRKSTKEIIKTSFYPREDMQVVEGMDPDYEWLAVNIPYAEPDYDSRLYIMERVLPNLDFLADFQIHPLYPAVREYRVTFNPVKRTKEEIIISIRNAEKEANDLVFSEAVHKDEYAFMLNSVHKDGKGLALNETEQGHIDKLSLVTVKLAKNKDTAEIKIAQVEAGQEPNIDEGWERSL